jgi:ABC-type multidrug transport system fused ATPase/permease subunit
MEKITGLVSKIMSGVIKDTKYLCDFYDFVHTVDGAKIKVSQKLDAQDAPLALGPFESLELKNISFTYPQSNKKALNTVSLTIQKGEIISILGYNGSGKTTLSKILNGSFSPQEGSVRLNGVELDDNTRRELFLYTGSGPQEFPRFSLSIRELVGLGRIEKAEDGGELRRAYAKAGLNDLLVKFKNGDGALLGKEYDPAGVELSGGEWQRLVIASAYMGGPELLILDEPTASIDPLTEMEVIKNLRENMEGKTAVLISHRIGFARMAGRIIMMENGTITEDGSHEELLEKGGYYAALFNEQKKLYMGDSRA